MIEFTGKPYSFSDYNCWDHAVAVRATMDIETPLFNPSSLRDAYRLIKDQQCKVEHGLTRVNEPQDCDIIIVHKMKNGKPEYHCGVYWRGYVSHCSLTFGEVRNQMYNDFIKDYEGATFWR